MTPSAHFGTEIDVVVFLVEYARSIFRWHPTRLRLSGNEVPWYGRPPSYRAGMVTFLALFAAWAIVTAFLMLSRVARGFGNAAAWPIVVPMMVVGLFRGWYR